jgi:hypothetical protein
MLCHPALGFHLTLCHFAYTSLCWQECVLSCQLSQGGFATGKMQKFSLNCNGNIAQLVVSYYQ